MLSSCANTPEKLDSFVTDLEQNADSYNEEDWQKSNLKFQELMRAYEVESSKYTEQERKMAANAIGRYHALLFKKGISLSVDKLNALKSILPDYLNGFFDEMNIDKESTQSDIESIMDTTGLNNAIETISSAFEGLFE